jgi:cell fate regulator YaaT (PSP1 superfamily)
MSHLIEVAFRGNRKEFFLWDAADPPPLRAHLVVEGDRGEDLGRVHAIGEMAEKRNLGCSHGCGPAAPTRRALRLATSADVSQAETLEKLSDEARRHAMERVRAQRLVMKISDAEWQWDRRKLTFFFTAEHRVDFRQLVRELAARFRTRIELKQIGVRDEAKRLDGIGRCGRQYCSASWLPELRPVNLGVAKDQRLSLNPAQISGACGRLMCCLRYEHDVYVAARRRFPKEGRTVATTLGEEKIIGVDIFSEQVTLRGADGETRTIALARFKEETGSTPEPALTDSAEWNVRAETALIEAVEAVAAEAAEVAELALVEGTAVESAERSEDVTAESARRDRRKTRRRGRRRGRRPSDRDGSSNGDGGPSGPSDERPG